MTWRNASSKEFRKSIHAFAAYPPFADGFVRRIASVEYIFAQIARRIVAIIRIVICHVSAPLVVDLRILPSIMGHVNNQKE